MRREWLIYGGMWTAATVAMLVVTVHRAPTDAPPAAAEGPLRTARDGIDRDLPMRPRVLPEPPEAPSVGEARMGRRRTGRALGRGPATASEVWSIETGHHVVAQAVAANARIFFTSRDHQLRAARPDGTELWRVDLGGESYSTPAVRDGTVYVGSDADRFVILDAATGAIRRQLATEGDADTGVAFAPNGNVCFTAGRDLVCVTRDGEPVFRFRTNEKVFSTPAIAIDGTVYFGSQDDHLYAVSAEGRLRWSVETRGDVDSTPMIGDDGTLYFGSDDRHLYAVYPSGEVRFRVEVGGYVRAGAALARDGREVLVAVFGPHARILALDAHDGSERWHFSVDASAANEFGIGGSPLIDEDGNVYFGADDDYVYAIDAGGRLRWVFQTGGNVDGDPVLVDGTLLVGSDDRRLHAIAALAPGDADGGLAPTEDTGIETLPGGR